MAVYKADILDVELNTGNIARSFLCHNIGKDDQKADRFGVRCFRDGEPVSLSGVSIQGFMLRPNGSHFHIHGSANTGVSGNEAWVDLPQEAYDYEGQFCLALKLIGGEVTGTIRIIDGMVNNTFVDGAVAPTAAVPTYQEILSVYDQMVAAKAGSVRFDTDQTLTAAQMTQARGNIEAASESDVADLKSAFDSLETFDSIISPTAGKIIVTSGDIGSVVDMTPVSNSSHGYQIVQVNKGEVYKLTASSNSPSARIWAFTDSSNVLLAHANSLESAVDEVIVAPKNGYLVVNWLWPNTTKALSKGHLKIEDDVQENTSNIANISLRIETIEQAVDNVEDGLVSANNAIEYYEDFDSIFSATAGKIIVTSGDIGSVVDMTPVSNSSHGYRIVQVKKGETYKLTASSNSPSARVWAFTDANDKLISHADSLENVTDKILVAPADGCLIINWLWPNTTKGLYKAHLKVENDISEVNAFINGIENGKEYGSILSPTASYIIDTSGNIGSVVNMTPVSNSSHGYQIVSVSKGDTFKITASSASPSARIWAFTDVNNKLISHADSLANATDLVVMAPDNGYLVVNFKWSEAKALSKGYIAVKRPFYQRKVAWYGDSIIQNGWWGKVSDRFSMVSTNCGVYGTRISGTDADCMCQVSRINGTYTENGKRIPDDAEYIIIGAGTNDWAQNVPLGNKEVQYDASWQIVEDVNTFYQACHVMFRRLAEQRPNAKVIVLGTPFGKMINRDGFTNKYGLVNANGLTSLDYGDALCDVAEMWGHYAIRYGKKMGINDNNVAALLDPTSESGSHLHPTTDTAKDLFRNAAFSGLNYLCEL